MHDTVTHINELITRAPTGKIKILLVQLGSPRDPSVASVRKFLREFLGDPRVVDINPLLWKIILNFFVLPFRPKKSAEAYRRIWNGKEFPLISYTRELTLKMQSLNEVAEIDFDYAFLVSSPRIGDVLEKWVGELTEGVAADDLWVVPMFPQYSESTVASSIDVLGGELRKLVNLPHLHFLSHFHRSFAFINGSARLINAQLAACKQKNEVVDALVFSFHGIPKRRVIYKRDPYFQDCYETFTLINRQLENIGSDDLHMTFQSRFGSEEWLTPYTDKYVMDLIKKGKKNILVYCPSFVADCLETIDEIGNELADEAREHGGKITLVSCLNTDDQWALDFKNYLQSVVGGQRREVEYQLKREDYMEMKEQKMISPPLTEEAKSSLKIVFLTLFLDLVSFSIIFPIFPALAKYYLTVDGDNVFLQAIFSTITSWSQTGGVENFNSIVLFGGALGALYSFLQFLAAPLWGALSDRIGRRPVLLISVFGLFLSYLIWFFSGNFTLILLARLIGGIMGGNISTATAVVADITPKESRSKGMAIIGIAFALGFIFGPALGGILSMVDLTTYFPALAQYGVNPFSMLALFACALSLFNVFYLYYKFKETLPQEKRGRHISTRTSNIFTLFRPLPYPGINGANIGHFLFLMAFSGMEFTLTFLAVERLEYSSLDNGMMFIFIGVLIALVQGGYVRRKAALIGEQKMALQGLVLLIPGLMCISVASNSYLLYLGLFFLAIGSSMAIPCLTSLVSLYSPVAEQGRSIGIFRSLGALARVVGPVVASILYWRYGSKVPYIIGALFLILPIIIVLKLPKVAKDI